MLQLTNLKDFNRYCEIFLKENAEFEEENYSMWFFSLSATINKLTPEELLQDVKKCLETYYFWQNTAVKQEEYESALSIKMCREIEFNHYIKLSNDLFKKSQKKEIQEIKNKLEKQYL